MISGFVLILQKLLPLYALVAVGFFAGKRLRVRKESLAPLLIYVLTPALLFLASWHTAWDLPRLSLPLLFWVLCSIVCIISLKLGARFFKSPAKNILALGAGNANSGYFALPVAFALYGEKAVDLVLLMSLGFSLYENTLGFFVAAQGKESPRRAFLRVLRLPTPYAFLIGLVLSWSRVPLPHSLLDFNTQLRGAYSVLGMMLIGLGASNLPSWKIEARFAGFALGAKFLLWPLVMAAFLTLEMSFGPIFSSEIRRLLALMSVLPMAANTVAFATELNAEPEKVAWAVLVSTVIGLVTVPLVTALFS